MAGGPLHWFRKNQKILLVVSGVLLMLVFTVGSVLDSFFTGQGQNSSPVRVVATTSFGDFTNRDMEEWTEANRRTVEFTNELFRLSGDFTKAKAIPIAPLNTSSTEARDRDILSRMAFARFAEEKGLYVGEEIINDYFNLLCNNELGNQGKTVEQFSRELQRGSLATVKAHLKKELLARCGQRMVHAGISPQYGQFGIPQGVAPTPLELWEGYRRMRERFVIEYMPVAVPSPESITDEPSEQEMRDLYNEGMDRPPGTNIALGPGFKKPRRATVSYFAINRKNFLEAEKAKITEEQILERYNEWVENEDRRVIESGLMGLPDGGAFNPGNGAEKEADANPGNKQGSGTGTDPAPGLNQPGNSKQPQGNEKKSGEAPDKDPESAADPGKSPAETGKSNGGGKAESDKGSEPQKSDKSSLSPSSQIQFVSLRQDQSGNESAGKEKQDSSTKPNSNAGEPAGKQDAADSAKKAASNSGKEQDSPANDSSANNQVPDSVPPASVNQENKNDDQEPPKPKIKPLDDKLKDLIREDLARPRADEAIAKVVEEVSTILTDYLSDYDYYSENPDEMDEMQTPDFARIAGEKGLLYKTYEQVDFETLRRTEFGKANVRSNDPQRQPGTVAFEIFVATFQTASNFEVFSTVPRDDIEYLFWVVDKKNREKVSFEEAKPAIIRYYKRKKALEAAEKQAAEIIDRVRQQKQTLSAAYGDKVTRSAEFGWMEIAPGMEEMAFRNPQLVQQMPQFFTPQIGRITPEGKLDADPLEGIDHQFMSRVFALEENEVGYAPDSTGEHVYVIQVVQRKKPTPAEKNQFFTRARFTFAHQTAQLDEVIEMSQILSGEDVLKKYSVKWFGEPENK